MRSTLNSPTPDIEGVSDEPAYGGELSYSRQLGVFGGAGWGIDAGIGYFLLDLEDRTSLSSRVQNITDIYALNGITPPAVPYTGTFNSLDPRIGSTPIRSSVTNLATTSGARLLETDIYTARDGPYLDIPLGSGLNLRRGGGAAVAFVPSVIAYQNLMSPSARKSNPYLPYLWVVIAAMISYAITSCVTSSQITSQARDGGDLAFVGEEILSGLLVVIFAIPSLILTTGVAEEMAQNWGGKGSYRQLVYLVAAYSAPLTIIAGVVGVIPWLGPILRAGIMLYGFILTLIAVKAVNDFGWVEAFISGMAGNVINIVLIGCATIFVTTLSGPAVGNSFYNIISNLEL